MEPTIVLTATLVSRVTGDITDAVFALPVPGVSILGWTGAFALLLILFIVIQRFQMWAILVAIVTSALYAPFSLTYFAPYIVLLLLVSIVFGSIIRFLIISLFTFRKRRTG